MIFTPLCLGGHCGGGGYHDAQALISASASAGTDAADQSHRAAGDGVDGDAQCRYAAPLPMAADGRAPQRLMPPRGARLKYMMSLTARACLILPQMLASRRIAIIRPIRTMTTISIDAVAADFGAPDLIFADVAGGARARRA